MDAAKGASLNSISSNPTEKVLILFSDCDCIIETISEESIPPDKNAPKGTSDNN